MHRLKRIITDNSFSYQNAILYDHNEISDHGIKKYITDPDLNQVVLKTDDGKIRILTDWMVGVIEYRTMNPPMCAQRVERIVINGEISYSPCFFIEIEDYKRANIPRIFKHQLSFVAEQTLCICHQNALIEICL